jgi:hypothetical protein
MLLWYNDGISLLLPEWFERQVRFRPYRNGQAVRKDGTDR